MVFGTTLLSLAVQYSLYLPPPRNRGGCWENDVAKPDKMLGILLIPTCKNKWIKNMKLKVG